MKILPGLLLIAFGSSAFAFVNNAQQMQDELTDQAELSALDAESAAFISDNIDPELLQLVRLRTTDGPRSKMSGGARRGSFGGARIQGVPMGGGDGTSGGFRQLNWHRCTSAQVSLTPRNGWIALPSMGYRNPQYFIRRAAAGYGECALRNR